MSDADKTREQDHAPAPPTKEQRRALRAAAAAEAGYIRSVRAS